MGMTCWTCGRRHPKEAARAEIMMIASRDAFDIGDTLTCRRADEAPALAEAASRLADKAPGARECARLPHAS